MTKIVPLAAALLLGLLSTASAAEPQRSKPKPHTSTRAVANLATYLSDDDYPEEAIRNNEQGTVGFRLDIGADGTPTHCTVISSSGSSSLDAATCRIMVERPRFQPARDRRGRPVPDQVTSRIRWKLPDESETPPRMQAAFMLWTSCILGETAKLAPSDLPVAEVARRSYPPCEALEALLAKESNASMPLLDTRGEMLKVLEQLLPETRNALKAPPETDSPATPTPRS